MYRGSSYLTMGYPCNHCGKILSRPQTLRNHNLKFHSQLFTDQQGSEIEESTPCKVPRLDNEMSDSQELIEKLVPDQRGRGVGDDSSDDGDDSNDDGDDTSDGVDSDEDNSENSEEEEEEDDDDDDEEDKEVDRVDDIFDKALKIANQNTANRKGEFTHKDLQKEFRRVYKDMVLQKRMLNKSEEHKRIMKTVGELRERHEDFTFEEALDEAVRLRCRMLNNMVPEPVDRPDEDDSDIGE